LTLDKVVVGGVKSFKNKEELMSITTEPLGYIIKENLESDFPYLIQIFRKDIIEDIIEHLIFLTEEGDRPCKPPTKEENFIGILEYLGTTGTFITSKDLEKLSNEKS